MNTQQAAVAISVVALAGWATGQTCVNGVCSWPTATIPTVVEVADPAAFPIDPLPSPEPPVPPAARVETPLSNCSGFARSSFAGCSGNQSAPASVGCGGYSSRQRVFNGSIRDRIRARQAARRSRWSR